MRRVMNAILWGLTLCVSAILLNTLTVNADFTLAVKFINYTNPSGLCAECNTRLADVPLDQIVPVCCDQTSQSDNCDNTGEESCDTRFRWTLREFGASIETRPATVPMAANPPYFFNPCSIPTSMCPFNETSHTFDQGDIAFLGRPNPYLANSTEPWTGRIQFLIEPNDGIPNIIDSIVVNLNTLQLGADFTEEMTYTGYHNISQMRMSFKVECSPNYCGPYCNVSSIDNPRIMSCASNGQITCVNGPDANSCTVCPKSVYNPASNCMTCLDPAYDSATNCSTCLNPNLDTTTSCTTCLNNGYSSETNCLLCLPNRDHSTNCATCLPNRDPSTNCATCMFGWDSERDCTECLPGRNMSTNCTTCLSGYTGDYCLTVTLMVDVALVGGVTGGVVLLVTSLAWVLVVIAVICTMKRKQRIRNSAPGSANLNAADLEGYKIDSIDSNKAYGFYKASAKTEQDCDESIYTTIDSSKIIYTNVDTNESNYMNVDTNESIYTDTRI